MRLALFPLSAACVLSAACGPTVPTSTSPPTSTAAPSASASASAGPRPADRPESHGPNGETATLRGARVDIHTADGRDRTVEPAELHPPAGDYGILRLSPTALLYLDDGTLLVGGGDGTVAAIDASGHHRSWLGFRGAVTGLVPAGDGRVAVTTDRGVVALMTGDGKVRWERQITAEKLDPAKIAPDGKIVVASPRGDFALSPAGETLNDPPPPPSLTPTFPLTFHKVLDDSVVSLLATGATEVSALATKRAPRNDYEWDTDDKYDVVQIDGASRKRLSVPSVAARSEVFIEGTHAAKAALFIDSMVPGPNGNPWIIARRIHMEKVLTGDALLGRWGGAGQILEVAGGKVRERSDLFAAFSKHWLSKPIAAAPGATADLLCFGEESPHCVVPNGGNGSGYRGFDPPADKIASLARVGASVWLLTADGAAYSADAKTPEKFTEVGRPDGAGFATVAGVSEKDVWAGNKAHYTLLHSDGADWKEVPTPLAGATIAARASDDVWSGRSRWDGKRWSIVHGAPDATVVLAKSKDDVWLGGEGGLWHGTAPGPSPVEVKSATPSDDGVPAAPAALPMGADDSHFAAQITKIDVAGGEPLDEANNVVASADGVPWFLSWYRIVEVGSDGKGTLVRKGGKGSDAFGRWALPEAKGRGIVLAIDEHRGLDERDEVWSIDGAKATRDDVQLHHHDLVAVSSSAGATWVLGAPLLVHFGSMLWGEDQERARLGLTAWEDFSPHALVRTGKDAFRPVLGLPAAAWCDVAATSDGGAWLAGGLSQGPSGEGILVHAKGSLGGGGQSRYRATASLLSVAAVGPDEAWAVGAGGTVIHVKGASVSRYSLPSGQWLRSVYASASDDVWMGGDAGTLLHFDGQSFHPVSHRLGINAAITGITRTGATVWAVGPSGILKIAKKP